MTMKVKIDSLKRIIEAAIGLVAITIGGLIYIRYRDENLLMFDWFQNIGILNCIESFRSVNDSQNLYGWVNNSMPAALWLFSYLFIIDSIWGKETSIIYKYDLYIMPVLAVGSEYLQYFSVLPGTYDILDVLGYAVACLLFIIIKNNINI